MVLSSKEVDAFFFHREGEAIALSPRRCYLPHGFDNATPAARVTEIARGVAAKILICASNCQRDAVVLVDV